MTTYRIDSMGGPIVRWVPTIEEALAKAAEFENCHTEVSTVNPDDGESCAEHVDVIDNESGRVVACIWPEKSRWPERYSPFGTPPDLTLNCHNTGYRPWDCSHGTLVAKNEGNIPVTECEICGRDWRPA